MRKIFIFILLAFVVMVCCTRREKAEGEKNVFDSLEQCIDTQKSVETSDSVFYIPVGGQDTFWYAKDKNNSVYLWAIVRGKGIHLIRDIK